MIMWQFALFLLPIAAYTGWRIAKKEQASLVVSPRHLSNDYYQGLHYLLNEQPDKALDAFIRMLDANPDSFETTLALGNFFRRRGEVDKAIRVHQNLVAKPNLTSKQKMQGLLELAQDYLRAGVYDRAESLFKELVHSKSNHIDVSLRHLIDIYEREKEWNKAIQVAQRLQSITGLYMGREIAHYYCESAEILWSSGKIKPALKDIKKAFLFDKTCVRASIIAGNIAKSTSDFKLALKYYKQVQRQDSDFISEVLFRIQHCFEKLNAKEAMTAYFQYLLNTCPNINVILINADACKKAMGEKHAASFLADQMRRRPSIRGIRHWVDYHLESAHAQIRDDLILLRSLIDKLLEHKPIYRCGHCGLSTKTLHWQCPSCRHWSAIKPIHRMEGEI